MRICMTGFSVTFAALTKTNDSSHSVLTSFLTHSLITFFASFSSSIYIMEYSERERTEKYKSANKSLPKDAQIIMSMLKQSQINDYDPHVINQLLEFTYSEYSVSFHTHITYIIYIALITIALKFICSLRCQ